MSIINAQATVTFRVYNSTTGAGVTGDAANLTLHLIADGVMVTPTNSPAELGYGFYKLVVTAAENTGQMMTLGGSSSTANAIVIDACWVNGYITNTKAGYIDAAISSRAEAGSIIGVVTLGDNVFTGTDVLEIIRGDLTTLTLTFEDSAGAAVDLTPYTTLTMTIKEIDYRDDTDDTNAALQITGVSASPTSGIATFTIPATDSESLSLNVEYDYDVQGDGGSGTVRTLARGILRMLHDVTRTSS